MLSLDQENWMINAARMSMSAYVVAKDDASDTYVFPAIVAPQLRDMSYIDCLNYRKTISQLMLELFHEN